MNINVRKPVYNFANKLERSLVGQRTATSIDGETGTQDFADLVRTALCIESPLTFDEALVLCFTQDAIKALLKAPNWYFFWLLVNGGAFENDDQDKIDVCHLAKAVKQEKFWWFRWGGGWNFKPDMSIEELGKVHSSAIEVGMENGYVLVREDGSQFINPIFELLPAAK